MKKRTGTRLLRAALATCLAGLPFLTPSSLHAQDTAPAAAKLPAAKEIFDRFVEVTGGADAYKKIKSQTTKGTFELVGANLKGDLTVYQAEPDKQLVKINLPGFGEMQEGFDGTVGWSINPAQGPMLKEGKALLQAKREATFNLLIDPLAQFKSATTEDIQEFAGEKCYHVKLVSSDDDVVNFFYSVKTGLFRGLMMTAVTPIGNLKTSAISSDYKDFGGIKMPALTTISAMGQSQKITANSMTFNDVPDSTFELPAAIKTLADAKKEKSGKDAGKPSS